MNRYDLFDYAERPPVRDGLLTFFGNALGTALLFSGIAIFVAVCHFA